ncbi:aldo/keto reductase [Paenibacillus flagellatus]|nr:aldo/keto reductase [Paenibacillus flagellatus]
MIFRTLGRTDVRIPAIGQGTWKFGERKEKEREEIEAIRFGIENGLTLIDTAESYADGGAEKVVGQAIRGVRDDVFLVTKVSASNGSYDGVLRAAEASLARLRTDRIDLYLQHWPSEKFDVAETMEAMAELVRRGYVRFVGVSNFDVDLLEKARAALDGVPLTCNQVAYHLKDRHIERSILPYCMENGITVMGYSPFGYAPQFFGKPGFPETGSAERAVLDEIGRKYGKTAHQVALNWVLRQEYVVSIPKAARLEHITDNLGALGWALDENDAARIDDVFPATGKPRADY